jgi:hypothetical protein
VLTVLALLASVGATSGATGSTRRVGRLALPAGAAASAQRAAITSVSCGATNSCVAVGSYVAAGASRPMSLTETRGLWSPGRAIALPGDATASAPSSSGPVTRLNGVACPAVGQCVAVGTYKSSSGFSAMIASASGGVFGAATRVPLPAHAASAGQLASLFAVSCVHWGYCTAVGTYADASGDQLPLAVSEHAGTWGPARSPALPGGALAVDQLAALDGVSCEGAGACRAVGGFVDGGGFKLMALTEAQGMWLASAKGAVIDLPGDAAPLATAEGNGLTAIDCTQSDSCVAVGQYATAGGYVALSTHATSGSWSAAAAVPAPSTPVVAGSSFDVLSAISCTSAGACMAVGTYGNAATRLPFTATMTSSTFTAGVEGSISLADASSPLSAHFTSLRCFSPSACLVVGDYLTAAGTEGLAATPATVPDPPTGVAATRGNRAVTVRWTAPLYQGLSPIIGYAATATPGGQSCVTTLTSCVIKGLTNGQRYTITVNATNAVGASVPSSPSAPISPATVPSAPGILSIASLASALRLTLKAPTNNGGAGISTYDYTVDGGASWHVRQSGTTELSLTITGLARRHLYHVAVRAVNGAGTGAASLVRAATTR